MRLSAVGWVFAAVGLALGPGACSDGGGGAQPPDDADRGETHVVFVGNSLTYTYDIPGLVLTIAEVAGESMSAEMIAFPNVSLEDHWLAGPARDVIAAQGPDVVVMQQGPSSLPQNQVHLREWSQRFADLTRQSGGEPGLYMVWPESTRREAFDAVSLSYRNAAAAVDGYLFPVGEAWRAVWRRAPATQLYGSDGFHPSRNGAVVAALTIFRVIFDHPVRDLPNEMIPESSGLAPILLGAEEAELFFEAVEEAVATFGGR